MNALILAGSRGPDDPMAKAAGVSHKALLPVAGVPMLLRVVETLRATPGIARIYVCIEDERVVLQVPALAALHRDRALEILPAADSPATPPQIQSLEDGAADDSSGNKRATMTSPDACEIRTTAIVLARRAARPPRKSAAP